MTQSDEAQIEPEAYAWNWLDAEFTDVAIGSYAMERAYSADEMVDAFLAGHSAPSRRPACQSDKAPVEPTDADGAAWEIYGPMIFHGDMTGPYMIAQVRASARAEGRREGIEEAEQQRALIAKLQEALVQHNDRLRSAQQIAQREGKDTNWLSFRGQCTYTLAEYHELTNECRALAEKQG